MSKCKSCANYKLDEGYRAEFVCTEGLRPDDRLTDCDGYVYEPGTMDEQQTTNQPYCRKDTLDGMD